MLKRLLKGKGRGRRRKRENRPTKKNPNKIYQNGFRRYLKAFTSQKNRGPRIPWYTSRYVDAGCRGVQVLISDTKQNDFPNYVYIKVTTWYLQVESSGRILARFFVCCRPTDSYVINKGDCRAGRCRQWSSCGTDIAGSLPRTSFTTGEGASIARVPGGDAQAIPQIESYYSIMFQTLHCTFTLNNIHIGRTWLQTGRGRQLNRLVNP